MALAAKSEAPSAHWAAHAHTAEDVQVHEFWQGALGGVHRSTCTLCSGRGVKLTHEI